MQAETQQEIKPQETLIIFDEVQECPRALTSLKYFCEDAPEYALAAAGSLLGVTTYTGTGFPVGKVNMLDLYPLSFREFLDAKNERNLRRLIDTREWKSLDPFSDKIVSYLKQYLYVGGMPEVLKTYTKEGNLKAVRSLQLDLIASYEKDMSKHLNSHDTEACIAVWNALPKQLSRENRRFILGHVKEGTRARAFHTAITWLTKAGLTYKVPRITKPALPLSSYADPAIYKLFCLDVGLLGALSGLSSRAIIDGDALFTEYKGALTEQYVCQELIADCALTPFYWSAKNSQAEVDFIVQHEGSIYPLEVKAAENLRSKSLRVIHNTHQALRCRRFSLSLYREQEWMKNIPLWAIGSTDTWE